MRAIRDIFAVAPLDAQILNKAIDSDLLDFEDAIQLYSDLRAGAGFLVTRDPADFPSREVPIVTPEEYLAVVQLEGGGT